MKTEVDRAEYSAWGRVRCENSRRGRDNACVLSPIRRGYRQKSRPTGLLHRRFNHMGTMRIFYVCLFVCFIRRYGIYGGVVGGGTSGEIKNEKNKNRRIDRIRETYRLIVLSRRLTVTIIKYRTSPPSTTPSMR